MYREYLETFYPTVLLALGPPRTLLTNGGVLTQDSYFEEFKKLAEEADVLGYKELRYPLTKAERDPKYRRLFDEFIWWWGNHECSQNAPCPRSVNIGQR